MCPLPGPALRSAAGVVTMYNPMSLRQAGRLEQVPSCFGEHMAVCLAGARLPREQPHLPVQHAWSGRFE
eukprot:8442101-Alexandrium_andersonii.AAC.1